ncbi:VOC family protein [Kurthia huakuii]|uniref:VOC family protein n=1 Tax=Kurthia huakuii TaxID=1421019 RepID=UPI002E100D0A
MTPYLIFNGEATEAISFYADVFQSTDTSIMTFGEAPENPEHPLPENAENRVMHGYVTVAGEKIMFSDTFNGTPTTIGNNVTLAVISNDEQFMRQAFAKLAEEGEVFMELQEMFFSPLYGSLRDKYDIEWQFNYE